MHVDSTCFLFLCVIAAMLVSSFPDSSSQIHPAYVTSIFLTHAFSFKECFVFFFFPQELLGVARHMLQSQSLGRFDLEAFENQLSCVCDGDEKIWK